MKAADVVMMVTAVLATPVWVYCAFQKWSRKPGAAGKMALSGCLFVGIILTGLLVAYLLG